MNATTASRPPIVIERTYRASAAEVWSLWTTKEGFESWWGPEGFRAEVHVLEPREGGALEYDMIADSPEMIAEMQRSGQPLSHGTRSRFSELVLHRRLVLTNVIDFIPNVAAYEAKITVELAAEADRIRMTVTLDALHDETFSTMQKEGFESQLRKLEARFGAG